MSRQVGRAAVARFLESGGLGGEEWSYTLTWVCPLLLLLLIPSIEVNSVDAYTGMGRHTG